MRKKLLFYGNCHLSAVSLWIEKNHSDKFEIIDCKNAGLLPFLNSVDKNFTVWSSQNHLKQQEFKENVHKEIRDCDFFIFQPHEGEGTIDELKTSFLVKNVLVGVPVCVSNTRMFVYPTGPRTSLVDIINYTKTNISNKPNEIIHYLRTEDDPKLVEIINRHVKEQEAGNICSKEKIEHSVCMLNYIENNWKTELLCCTINHPTIFYYKELIKCIFEVLREELPLILDMEYPSSIDFIDPLQFNFFKKICPKLQIPGNIIIHDFTEKYLMSNKLI